MAPPRLARVPLRHAGRHAGRTLRYYVEGESWSPTTSYAVASYSWRMALRSCGDLRIGGATNYNGMARLGITSSLPQLARASDGLGMSTSCPLQGHGARCAAATMSRCGLSHTSQRDSV